MSHSPGTDTSEEISPEAIDAYHETWDELDEQIESAITLANKLDKLKDKTRSPFGPEAATKSIAVLEQMLMSNKSLRSAFESLQTDELQRLRATINEIPNNGLGRDDPMTDQEPRPLPLSTEISRQSLDNFHDFVFRGPFNMTHVLTAFYNKRTGPALDRAASSRLEVPEWEGKPRNPSQRPQRLMIGSDILLEELQEITSTSFGKVPAVIIPPYKVLFHHWDNIQARLESLVALKTEAEADAGTENKSTAFGQSQRPFDQPEMQPLNLIQGRLDHLQCLVDFIRGDLGDILDIRARVANGTIEKIAFVDLWHLFNPGDTILSFKKGGVQAQRVYHVTGGRYRFPFKKSDGHPPRPGRYISRSARRYEIERAYDRRDNLGLKGWSSDESESSDDDGPRKPLGSYSPLYLDCLTTMFDGSILQPRRYKRRIDYYTGQRSITELPVYPIQFHDPAANMGDRLTRRGERFVSCSGHKMYSGQALKSLDIIQGEVYVDFKTGFAENRLLSAAQRDFLKLGRQSPDSDEVIELASRFKAKGNEKKTSTQRYWKVPIYDDFIIDSERADDFINENRDLLQDTDPEDLEPGDERFRLLPRNVVAFSFRTRKWHFLDVDLIEDIDMSELARDRGFDDLVVSDTYKQLLVALVENHRSGVTGGASDPERSQPLPQMDIVRNKAQGICILLHGPPGVGKTSTAETIAAYTKRPLYSITCGDMGLYPSAMEERLEKHFALANKWGCVLLLDEADVFLMARDWQDVDRNSSVSVFLRLLEYYSGILFLTTNRVGVIDEAFKSRIHVSLRYPSLGLLETKKIWENLLNRIERDNETRTVKVAFDRITLLAWAEAHYKTCEPTKTTWNGRQIRNAFQTAIALGRADRLKKLKEKDITEDEAERMGKPRFLRVLLTDTSFVKIAETARDFEDYLVSVRGRDAKTARDREVRDDDYDPSAPPRAQKSYKSIAAAAGRGSKPALGDAGSAMTGIAKNNPYQLGGDSSDETE
ncbi:hypothetical protein SCUP515_09761 [Seiridium cupressi]